MQTSHVEKPSFKAFLASQTLVERQNYELIVAMDLASDNPASHRLVKHSAKRVILQHQKEIEALKDKYLR